MTAVHSNKGECWLYIQTRASVLSQALEKLHAQGCCPGVSNNKESVTLPSDQKSHRVQRNYMASKSRTRLNV